MSLDVVVRDDVDIDIDVDIDVSVDVDIDVDIDGDVGYVLMPNSGYLISCECSVDETRVILALNKHPEQKKKAEPKPNLLFVAVSD